MKVVIVGAGFGGLRLARKLSNQPGLEVVLVDRFNYHQFQPLFYQVATAGLDASNISFPLRKVFHKSRNVRIRLACLEQVVPGGNKIITDREEISYDMLVLATGADTNFFGQEQLSRNAFSMKSTVEALQLRYRLLQNFENALTVNEPDRLKGLLQIVVVGGGPTGVELAGALAEMKKYVLPRDYPELDFSQMKIYLVDASERTLSSMSEKSSAQSRKYLDRLGVIVKSGSQVMSYDGITVQLQSGESVRSDTVIWAAGIKGNIPDGIDKNLIASGNRIKVDRYCQALGFRNIFVLGDLAYMETPDYPKGHPQVAAVAIQQAVLVAHNLIKLERRASPERLKEFTYRDMASMATVGRNLAVVDFAKPRIHFGGFLAWFIWMSLHLMLILGVKNRFFVFCNWLYNYITYDQNLRLIFREFNRNKKPG